MERENELEMNKEGIMNDLLSSLQSNQLEEELTINLADFELNSEPSSETSNNSEWRPLQTKAGILFVQLDNCVRENKNQFLILILECW